MAEEEESGLADGQIEAMLGGQKDLEGYLQVVKIDAAGPKKKLTLSDGSKSALSVLASQCEAVLGEIEVGSIVQLKSYNISNIQGKKMIIILGMEVTQKECEKLGNPVAVNQGEAARKSFSARATNQKRTSLGMLGSSSNHHSGDGEYLPISQLNPFNGGRSNVIKVRVTEKDDIRTWNNARGTGKLFSFNVMDKDGGEIRITAFNDECEKFCPLIEENGTYTIKGFRVKQDTYKSRINNEYAITLQRDSEIKPVQETNNFAQKKLEFTTIADLEGLHIADKESVYVNMMVYVREVGEINNFQSRSGKDLTKRDVTIADHTNVAITCTLWGKHAENNDANVIPPGTVLCLPNCRVSSFGGRSVSANSIKTENIDQYEIYQNVQVASTGPNDQSIKKLTRRGGSSGPTDRLTWGEAFDGQKGHNTSAVSDFKGDYFEVSGFIRYVPHNFEKPPWYKSVPSDENNSKVIEENGKWLDTKTNTTYDTYVPRYVLRLQLSDHTGGQYVTAFNEEAEQILGVTAKTLEESIKNGDEAGFEKPFADANFKMFTVKIKAKPDEYNGQTNIRYNCLEVAPTDYLMESQKLFEEILGMDPAE